MIVYAGSARRQFVPGAVLVVTSLSPLGIVPAAIIDRIFRESPKNLSKTTAKAIPGKARH